MGLAVCLILAIFPALAPPQCRKVLAVHLLDLVIYMSLHRRETSFLPYARPVLEARSRPSATSRGPPSLTRSSCCTEGGGIRDSIRLRFAPYLTFRYSNWRNSAGRAYMHSRPSRRTQRSRAGSAVSGCTRWYIPG